MNAACFLILGVLYVVYLVSTAANLSLLSTERFMALKFPLRNLSLLTDTGCNAIILWIWVLSIFVSIGALFFFIFHFCDLIWLLSSFSSISDVWLLWIFIWSSSFSEQSNHKGISSSYHSTTSIPILDRQNCWKQTSRIVLYILCFRRTLFIQPGLVHSHAFYRPQGW